MFRSTDETSGAAATRSATETWRPLPPRLDVPEAPGPLSRRQVRAWVLVLKARLIPCHTVRDRDVWQLLVPQNAFTEALQELRQFEAENRHWPPPPPEHAVQKNNLLPTLWVLIGLGVFYDVTLGGIPWLGASAVPWLEIGDAHAAKILAGEWWRSVTALTLHSGWLHLLSNLLIGGVFIISLCRDLGSGLGWALILASGMAGNLINAWLQAPEHHSVGASTAIFGAVGLLAAISLVRHRHHLRPQRRWGLPVAAALGLLAMLGAGGEQTDLGAHLLGFLCGLLFGIVGELILERTGRPGRLLNAALCLACLGLVAGAWLLAVGSKP